MTEAYSPADTGYPDPRLTDTQPYGMDMRIALQKPTAEVAEGLLSTDIDGVIGDCAAFNCDLVAKAIDDRTGYRVPLCPVITTEKDDDEEPVAAFWSRECQSFDEPLDGSKDGMDEPNRKMMQLMADSLGVESDRIETMPTRSWQQNDGTMVTLQVTRYWVDYARLPGDIVRSRSIDASVVTFTPKPPSEERWAQYLQDGDALAWPPIQHPTSATEVWCNPPDDDGIWGMWNPSEKPGAAAEADRLTEQTRRMNETAEALGLTALSDESGQTPSK